MSEELEKEIINETEEQKVNNVQVNINQPKQSRLIASCSPGKFRKFNYRIDGSVVGSDD